MTKKFSLRNLGKVVILLVLIWLVNCVLVLGFGKNIFGKWSVFLILPKETLKCEKGDGTYVFDNDVKSFVCSGVPGYLFYPSFDGFNEIKKPIIYLYPTNKTKVSVKVTPKLGVKFSYPKYNDGWSVIAEPNGQLTTSDGSKYNYLFWEADRSKNDNYNLNIGFVIKGKDTIDFLKNKLEEIGLEPKEYNDMISYWLPRMEKNKYNLIHFATDEEYNQKNPLEVNPKPESVLRVFMVFKPSNKEVKIKPQEFKKFERNGFTVVEWGGSEL